MKEAVEEVDKCRMTLKWTYVMAYYLAKGNEKDLFEDNQRSVFIYLVILFLFQDFFTDKFVNDNRDLEKAVENLSEMLEYLIKGSNITGLRRRVMNKTVCFPYLIYHS